MRIDLHNTAHNGIGMSFANYCQVYQKRVRFREEHRLFRAKYGGCTIFSQKPCDGEKKRFLSEWIYITLRTMVSE